MGHLRSRRVLAFILVAAAMLAASTAHAQSELQRCLSLPSNTNAAVAEYCQGIRAAEQQQNQSAAFQHYLRSAQMGYSVAQAVVGAAY